MAGAAETLADEIGASYATAFTFKPLALMPWA
jgi:hypothetical protein